MLGQVRISQESSLGDKRIEEAMQVGLRLFEKAIKNIKELVA